MQLNHKFGWREIEGWFNFCRVYDRIIRESKSGDQIVEVGTWFGKSTCYLTSRAKMSGKPLKIFAVDNFKKNLSVLKQNSKSIYSEFIQNMTKAGVIDIITVLPIESTVAAHNFSNESLSTVLLNNNQNYEQILSELKAWYPKVKKGGIIAGQNYCFQAVKNAIKNMRLKVEIYAGDVNEWEFWVHNK